MQKNRLLCLLFVPLLLASCASKGLALKNVPASGFVGYWPGPQEGPRKVAVLPFAFQGRRFAAPATGLPFIRLDSACTEHMALNMLKYLMPVALAADLCRAIERSQLYELNDSWISKAIPQDAFGEVEQRTRTGERSAIFGAAGGHPPHSCKLYQGLSDEAFAAGLMAPMGPFADSMPDLSLGVVDRLYRAFQSKEDVDLLSELGIQAAICGEVWWDSEGKRRLTLYMVEQRDDRSRIAWSVTVDDPKISFVPFVQPDEWLAEPVPDWATQTVAAMGTLARLNVELDFSDLEKTPSGPSGGQRVKAHLTVTNRGDEDLRILRYMDLQEVRGEESVQDACDEAGREVLERQVMEERIAGRELFQLLGVAALPPQESLTLTHRHGVVWYRKPAETKAVVVSVLILEPVVAVISTEVDMHPSRRAVELTE